MAYETEGSDNKMSGQRTDHEIREWCKKIEASKNLREKISTDYTWKEIIDEFHGKFNWSKWGLSDIYIPPLNLIFAFVESEVPSLYFRDPHIKINPKNAQSIMAAKLMEKAVNYIWKHQRIKRENTKNVQDSLLVGHSWFKTGYSGEFGSVEDANGNKYEFIEKENFFGYRIPWDMIYFNQDALDPPYDCTWIAQEVWISKEVAEKSGTFNKDALQQIQWTSKKNKDFKAVGSTDYQNTDDTQYACVYEVWDKTSMQKFTISAGCPKYIEDPKPWPYELRGFPFSYLCFNPSPMQPLGIPDVYTFRPQILELMKVYAMMLDHLKRFNRQLAVYGTPLTDDQLAQLAQGITGSVLNGLPSDTRIEAIVYPPIQQDIYAIERLLKEMLINISGQSPQERGATQQTSTRTFRELAQIRRGAENRRSRKIDLIEDFVEDIAGNLVALLQQYADIPFYVRITGDDYKEIEAALASRPSKDQPNAVTSQQGFTFTKEDIQGEFDLDVVAGSTTPLDREQTMQILTGLIPELQAMGVRPGGPVVGAIGNLISENLEMPEIQKAIVEEAKMNAEAQKAQQEQAEEQQAMMMAKETSKLNIDAGKLGVKQNQLLIDAMKHMTPDEERIEGEAE